MNAYPFDRKTGDRQIAIWLLLCAATVYAMIVLGGVTRLTHSGLSIVDWKPVSGVLPPLSENDWHAEFKRYQAFPEYQTVNQGISLAEFKRIFYFEYAHRLLGRLIGLMFLLPLVYFALRGRIGHRLINNLVLIFILGAFQGVLGWYMVKSGLVDVPRVSQYRLAAHLGMAVIIYACLVRLALALLCGSLLSGSSPAGIRRAVGPYRRAAAGLTALIFVMILSGAFVAGTRAGLAYPTFPLMGDAWIPQGLFALHPWWSNFFENVTMVQFVHRLLAVLVLLYVAGLSVTLLCSGAGRSAYMLAAALLLVAVLQLSLGIATLLQHVPVGLAALHQAGAILLFTVSLVAFEKLRFSDGT